jgi:hypothetical protein
LTFWHLAHKPSAKRRASISLPHLLHLFILCPLWLVLIVPTTDAFILSKERIKTENIQKKFLPARRSVVCPPRRSVKNSSTYFNNVNNQKRIFHMVHLRRYVLSFCDQPSSLLVFRTWQCLFNVPLLALLVI